MGTETENSILRLELQILLLAYRGVELPAVLREIGSSIERRSPGTFVSIQLVGDDGQLWPTPGGSAPEDWVRQITPLPIGPTVGACGAAAYLRHRVVAADIEHDPNWVDYRDAALRNGLRACWSEPVIGLDGQLLGTFAMYYGSAREPTMVEVELIEMGAHLARAAIERHRINEERRRLMDETRRAEERGRLAMDVARLGTWQHDPATNMIELDERMRAMWNQPPPPARQPLADLFERVHPDDQERIQDAVRSALAAGSTGGYDVQFRIVWDDGSEHWIAARGQVQFALDDDGAKAVDFMGTALDVTEQKRAEEALRAANRQKDAFLAALGHELRNPLAPILNAAQLLERRAAQSPEIGRPASIIVRQAQHMASLLNDLLDVARIARGTIQLDFAPLDLLSLVRSTAEDHQLSFSVRGIEFLSSVPDDRVLQVRADETRLRQMLGNLLHNALKFSDPGGTVWLRVSDSDGQAEIVVSDTGVGIEPERLGEILDDSSYPSHPHPDRERGGLGLGLAVTNALARQHGGSLSASSDGLGKGATFTLTLPVI